MSDDYPVFIIVRGKDGITRFWDGNDLTVSPMRALWINPEDISAVKGRINRLAEIFTGEKCDVAEVHQPLTDPQQP